MTTTLPSSPMNSLYRREDQYTETSGRSSGQHRTRLHAEPGQVFKGHDPSSEPTSQPCRWPPYRKEGGC